MMYTLWRWSPRADAWSWETEAHEDKRTVVMRSHKRRNPTGTKFRWVASGLPAPKRFRKRAAK
jgi:hypothetical protein